MINKFGIILKVIVLVLLFGVPETEAVGKVSVRQKRDGMYEIRLREQTMLVDAACGARVVSLKYKKRELLTQPEVNALNYGSTLWLSPQKWGWPPPEVPDRGAYEVTAGKDWLKLKSALDPVTGCVVTKTIVPDLRSGSFEIRYEITNRSTATRSFAPWEVTRVPARGVSFFPIGSLGGKSRSNLATAEIDGLTWFAFDPGLITDHQKLFRNGGEGWLAHAADGLLFIKQFPDIEVEQEAPGETEVEIYVCKDKTYMELENQGAYEQLPPGGSITWKVHWYLRELAPDIPVEPGSRKLAEFVRSTIRHHEFPAAFSAR